MTAETTTSPSSLERKFPLTIHMSEVEAQAQKRLAKMGKTMKMPGFRPGKVPMKVVAQAYGAQAQSEAIGDVVSRAYSEAVVAQKLKPAGPPSIQPLDATSPAADAPTPAEMHFEAVVEVYPEIALPQRESLAVQKWVAQPTEADVDRTLETLRKQKVNHETVRVRPRRRIELDSTSRAASTTCPSMVVVPPTFSSWWAQARCCRSSMLRWWA